MFWGCILKKDQSSKFTNNKNSNLLHISNCAMTYNSNGKIFVFAKVNNVTHQICVLEKGKLEHCLLDLYFRVEQNVEFSIKSFPEEANSKNEIHLSGYYEPNENFQDIEEDSDESEEVKMAAPVASVKAKEQQQQKKTAAPEGASKKVVKDDDAEDDEDDDEEFDVNEIDESDDEDDEGLEDEDEDEDEEEDIEDEKAKDDEEDDDDESEDDDDELQLEAIKKAQKGNDGNSKVIPKVKEQLQGKVGGGQQQQQQQKKPQQQQQQQQQNKQQQKQPQQQQQKNQQQFKQGQQQQQKKQNFQKKKQN